MKKFLSNLLFWLSMLFNLLFFVFAVLSACWSADKFNYPLLLALVSFVFGVVCFTKSVDISNDDKK